MDDKYSDWVQKGGSPVRVTVRFWIPYKWFRR
jgi:hypothetical protein